MPVALNGSPAPNGGVVPGSTLERQLLSIEASKRARAAGEPVPPPVKAASRPQNASLAAQAARQRSKSRSRSGSPATPLATPRAEDAAVPAAAAAAASGEPATPPEGAAAAAPPQRGADGGGAAAGSPPGADAIAARAAEDDVLAQADAVRARRSQLALAYGRPWGPPPAPPDHRTYLCQEAVWLAVDFAQERLWKRFAAKSIAYAAAAERRAKTLKPVPQPVSKCGDQLGKVLGEGGLERAESAGRRTALTRTGSRVSRKAPAGAKGSRCAAAAPAAMADEDGTGADSDEDLGPATPPSFAEGSLLYYGAAAAAAVPGMLAHLQAQLEARIVDSRLAIRAWEEEYAAAKEERAEALKRSAADGDRLAGAGGPVGGDMYPVDDLGAAAGGRKSSSRRDRQKRNRVPNYALVEEDIEWDTEDPPPPPRQRPPPTRRPPPLLRGEEPLTGTRVSERQAGRKRRAEAADLDDFEPGGRRLHRRTAPPPRSASGRDRRASGRRGDGGQDAGWTKEEDELLAAVVHEFGENYRLVSDVMSPSALVTGAFRNAKACAERFKKLAELSQAQRGAENADSAVAVLGMNKAMARQLIATQLPAPDSLLRSRMDILFDCGQRARERRSAQQEAARNSNRGRTEPHPSQAVAVQRVLATSGGQALDPLRIAGIQMGSQAAAPMVFPTMVAGGLQPAGSFPPIGAPPGAALGAQPGTPRLQGAGSGVVLPAAASPGALQPAAAPGQPPGMPPGGAAPGGGQPPAPRPRGVSTTELQRILQTGRAPNGQPITESQRTQIVQQLRLRQQQTQAKLQQMLNHGTPEQQQQARQALATHAARQQAAQAAAQARSQTPNGMAAQQQQPPQPAQPMQQVPAGAAAGHVQPQLGQAPAAQQQQLQQQQVPAAAPPGQPPGQPLQQPPSSLAMPHGGSLAAIRPAGAAAAPGPQTLPQQQAQSASHPGPPHPAAGGPQPSQPVPAAQLPQQQQQPLLAAQHLAASQAALLAQQRQRAALQQQQQPGMPVSMSQPQPQQQLQQQQLPQAAAGATPAALRPAMPGIPRPGAAAMPTMSGQPRLAAAPTGSQPQQQQQQQQQPLPGQQPAAGQGGGQPPLQQAPAALPAAAGNPRQPPGAAMPQQQPQPPGPHALGQARPPAPGQQQAPQQQQTPQQQQLQHPGAAPQPRQAT